MSENLIVNFEKLGVQDYVKPILFTALLIVIAMLLHSDEIGIFKNAFNLIWIGLIILLIPINQIFRIRRIHIYSISINGEMVIKYQEILKDRMVNFDLDKTSISYEKTKIRDCKKLIIQSKSMKIEQYCNKYWTNEIIDETSNKLSKRKKDAT